MRPSWRFWEPRRRYSPDRWRTATGAWCTKTVTSTGCTLLLQSGAAWAVGSTGSYPLGSADHLTAERQAQWFTVQDERLVVKPELIVIHVNDHGKPMKLSSASGKVTVFNGNDKTEAPLALVGDKLEAKGSFKLGAGTKVLADLAVNGKPAVAARFTLK